MFKRMYLQMKEEQKEGLITQAQFDEWEMNYDIKNSVKKSTVIVSTKAI